jgi:hypothetical protein
VSNHGRVRTTRKRGWFERFLFSFMGPPQLGDASAAGPAAAVPSAPCPKCGEPYDAHQIVRDPRLTYARCPEPRQPI